MARSSPSTTSRAEQAQAGLRAAGAALRVAKAETAIEEALASGNPRRAVQAAVDAVKGEVVSLLDEQPGVAGLACAELAANLIAAARTLHRYVPRRLGGWSSPPVPHDLLQMYDRTLAMHAGEGEGS